MSEQQKADFERNQFLRAAEIAGVEVVADSVESRRPPEPDILCTLGTGEIVAFELVELVDPDEPRSVSRAIETGSIEVFGIDTTKPTCRSLRRKLVENLYRTQHPMELIAFGSDTLGPKNMWVPTHDNNLIQDWLNQSAFRRLRVVCLGRREPGVWLDRIREP